jgi:hydroxysqualene dehydroxylase
MKRRIAIIGGGLAGIAAAIRLCEAGEQPILIETRKKLGGRATSFTDPRTGALLDNCQHVLMGCCTNLIDLYDRLGVLDRVQWHRTLYWSNAPDRPDIMRGGWLPAPLHLAGSFGRLHALDAPAKKAVRRAMLAMVRLGYGGRARWRHKTFREYLDHLQQPPSAIDRFWNVVIVSACNLDVARVSAEIALKVFQEGFLSHGWAYTMGLPECALIDIYDPAVDRIREAGGEIHLGVSAKALAYDGSRISGVVTDEGMIEASATIAAVPPDRLDKLTSETLKRADGRLQRLGEFEFTPILGVHLFFETPVMDTPHMVLPGADTQWLFNKSQSTGQGGTGVPPVSSGTGVPPVRPLQHIHAVISGADSWMDLDEPAIVERVMADIHRHLPRSVGLQPVEYRAVKEKRATFAATPHIEPLRPTATPPATGGVRNLYLAGDWTDTGWPATMESAVRSGYAAAAAITGEGGLIPELPIGMLARLLGLR